LHQYEHTCYNQNQKWYRSRFEPPLNLLAPAFKQACSENRRIVHGILKSIMQSLAERGRAFLLSEKTVPNFCNTFASNLFST